MKTHKKIEKVTVFGSGQLGAQLVFYIAFKGFDVTVFDLNDGLLEEARTKFRQYAEDFQKLLNSSTEEVNNALARIAYSKDLIEASGNADIAIESVPEDPELKRDFFIKLGKAAPQFSIFATTTLSKDLESLAKTSGREKKFLSINFDEPVWEKQKVEVKPLQKTSKESQELTIKFLEALDKEVHILEPQKA